MKPNNNKEEDGLNLKKGPWTTAEDAVLVDYVKKHGEGNWNSVQKNSGLLRCGKSCRLRWTNHLRPNLKKGSFSPEEEKLIMELHAQLGNKWSRMAARLPGRTDNEIKNYWNTKVKRRQRDGSFPQVTHKQIGTCHLRHHYEHHSSQIPQQKNFSSFSQVNYGSLSVFNQTSLSTMTSIPMHQQVQCNGLESSLPSFQNAPPLSPQFSQNFPIQSAPASSYPFKCDYYDINPPPIRQTPFEPDRVATPCSAFPVKLELPSSQLPQPAVNAAALGTQVDYGIIRQLARKNSGLLDDVLQEAKDMSTSNVSKVGEFCESDGFLSNASPSGCVFMDSNATPQSGSGSQWFDSRPTDYLPNVKSEPKGQENTVDGNLSNLFDVIPSTLLIPDWAYSSSGEISNGQSSCLTDSDINLEIEQLVLSLLAVDTTTVHERKLGTWNTMPRMF